MKKITNFLNTAKFWQIYLVSYPFVSLIIFILWFGLGEFISLEPDIRITIYVKMALTLGVVFTLMFTLMNSMVNSSNLFWDKVNEFKIKLDGAETKENLTKLHSTDFVDLRKLAVGQLQYNELHKLQAIMETKYKYVN